MNSAIRHVPFFQQISSIAIRNYSSSFVHDAYHQIQNNIVSNVNDLRSLTYNEADTRKWLSTFPGGNVILKTDQSSKVATILMENQQAKNAFTGKMMVDFSDILKELSSWKDGRLIILKGSNGDFCSGGDLNFISQIAAEPVMGARMCIFMQHVTSRLAFCPLISVAVIEGYALGGGAELSVACDFRLMHSEAQLGFSQSLLGISPAWGGGTHLIRRVGLRHGLSLLASGRMINAWQALEMGLSDGSFDSQGSEQQIEAWLAPFLDSNPEAAQVCKRVALNALECNYAESLNREKDALATLWGSAAHKKAMQEFLKNE